MLISTIIEFNFKFLQSRSLHLEALRSFGRTKHTRFKRKVLVNSCPRLKLLQAWVFTCFHHFCSTLTSQRCFELNRSRSRTMSPLAAEKIGVLWTCQDAGEKLPLMSHRALYWLRWFFWVVEITFPSKSPLMPCQNVSWWWICWLWNLIHIGFMMIMMFHPCSSLLYVLYYCIMYIYDKYLLYTYMRHDTRECCLTQLANTQVMHTCLGFQRLLPMYLSFGACLRGWGRICETSERVEEVIMILQVETVEVNLHDLREFFFLSFGKILNTKNNVHLDM